MDQLDRAEEKLAAAHGATTVRAGPIVPTIYRSGTLRLSLFAIIAQFGTPEDLLLEDMKIELFFPNDDESDKALRAVWSG